MRIYTILPLVCLMGCNPLSNFTDTDEGRDADSTEKSDETASDQVDEPSMVGGSYLTCSMVEESAASGSDQSEVGCWIDDKNGKKTNPSANVRATVVAFDVFNKQVDGVTVEQNTDPDYPYTWTVNIATDKITEATVQITLLHLPTGISKRLMATVENTGNLGITVERLFQENIHIGDWNIDAIPTEIETTTCAGLISGPISESSGRVEIPFTVASEEFGISLKSCDALRPKSNLLELVDESGAVVKSMFFVDGQNDYLITNEGWGVGTFKLVISGKNALTDLEYDNFIVRSVEIKSAGGIITGSKTAKQPSPPVMLQNLPIGISKVDKLNITVIAKDPTKPITHYKYKVNEAKDFKCEVKDDYSPLRPVSMPITDDISDFGDGTVEICVIGHNSAANPDAVLEQYFSAKWEKN
ncbi:MAG: hypothetical protein AB7T49_02790 [Oligoflexales bacterium]